jgi:hypothetical protein
MEERTMVACGDTVRCLALSAFLSNPLARFTALAGRWFSHGMKLVSQLNKTLVLWDIEAIGEGSGGPRGRHLQGGLTCIVDSTPHGGSRMPGW